MKCAFGYESEKKPFGKGKRKTMIDLDVFFCYTGLVVVKFDNPYERGKRLQSQYPLIVTEHAFTVQVSR